MENVSKTCVASETNAASKPTSTTISRQIGGTKYLVSIHFSENATDNIEDVILRMLEKAMKTAA